MAGDLQRGRVLVDRELKELTERGHLLGNDLAGQIQSASFDPKIGDEIFMKNTVIKPNKQVYRNILETEYTKTKIRDFYELQVGKTYYLKLEERLNLVGSGVNYVKATPKSSIGRIFLYTRLISDFSPSFNEIKYSDMIKDKELELWLVVQPLAFNVLIYPGISLNQLKFFKGLDYMLSDSEIVNLHKEHEIVRGEGNIESNNGLKLSLNLYGKDSEGIVGLKAKESLRPLDMKEKHNRIESFFEPIISKKGKVVLKPRDKAIFYTSQNLTIPKETNAQLSDYYDVGINALLHLAGFFDPNFSGNAVLEVISYENREIELRNNMDFALLQFFRNKMPDKAYGDKALGSHYQHQKGPKVSKFFEPAEYADLRRKWKKLKKKIVTVPRRYLENILTKIKDNEFVFLDDSEIVKMEKEISERPIIIKRFDCELNPDLLQPIPYVLIFNEKKQVMVYKRAKDKKDFGEGDLFGKISIGAGGHFIEKDKTLEGCINREVMQEELDIQGFSKIKFLGALYTERKRVDTVHIGMIYAMLVKDAKQKEKALKKVEFISFDELKNYPNKESWTQILGPYLLEIYKRLRG